MKSEKSDPITIWATRAYAALLILGGIIGFLKTGSRVSIFSGVGSGIILQLLSFGMKKSLRPYTFATLGLIIALMGSFFFRAIASHKIIPTLLGAISLTVFLLLSYRMAKKTYS